MARILIADDEPVILKVLAKFLKKPGREIFLAASAAEALDLGRRHAPLDVALLDKNLGDRSGLEVARELKGMQEDLAVILITGYASLQSAIEAVQIGAYDYLTKPIDDPASLDLKVTNAEERVRLARERRALATALAESEERYRSIFETSPDAIVLFEPGSGRIRDTNLAAEQAFARDGGLAGVGVADLFAESSPGQPTPPGGPAVTGRRGDGSTFEAEIRPGTLTLRGEELHTLAVRDVSARERLARERSQVEDQLRQAQKMDAIGRLAGGLGHDLGNMLAVVMTYVDLLRVGAEGTVREDLEMAQVAAERAAQLVRQLMTLARQGPGNPVTASVNVGVAETVKLLRRSLPEDVALHTELGQELWLTLLDQSQLAQVLINLCVNARDAMAGGGQLTIATANLAAEAPRPPGVPPGAWVLLSVRDTGIGMSSEVRNRIFEPFFTTKETGKGTGLGLSVVHGIVRQAGGFVAVESAPGQGTTLRLGFPRAAGAATQRGAAERNRGELSRRGQTVLVAEDEAALRAAVVRSLTGAGFRVLEGESADAALAAARSHRGSIDLLLTDFVMPGKSGAHLAEALRRDRPGVKVLFMTGFPGDPRVAEALSGTAASDVLQKPFNNSTLVEHVRRLLG
jgi:two-component system, cell cycle sensor histidine kinase and response regulator CckA